MPHPPDPRTRALTLVRGGSNGSNLPTAGVDELVAARSALRPGDRHEPWTLSADRELCRIAEDAAHLGLDFEIAMRLVVEIALTARDLLAAGVDPASIDEQAERARVQRPVDAAGSSYFRHLLREETVATPALGDIVNVGLPMRLTVRLLAVDLPHLLAAANVSRARMWEIAALSEGMTLSAWAALRARSASA